MSYNSDSDNSYGDGYGGNIMHNMEREFGRNCSRTLRNLESTPDDSPLNIDVGVNYSGDYGPMTIEDNRYYGVSSSQPFRKLCKALGQLPDDRDIDSIKFHHFEMNPGGRTLSMVKSSIMNKRIRSLDIANCCTSIVSEFMETNQTLEDLRVDCGILGGDKAQRFSDAIRGHLTLEKVSLVNCELNEQTTSVFLEAVKDKREVAIKREYSYALDNKWKQAHTIPSVLATNPPLQKLCIQGAEMLGDWHRREEGYDRYEVIKNFAAALSTNSHLKELILHDLNRDGEKILLKAIYDDDSLDSLALSNHTCIISVPCRTNNRELEKLNKDYEWVQGGDGEDGIAQKSKLLHAVGAFNEESISVQHLLDLPLELVPRTLQFLQDMNCFEEIDNDKLSRLAFKNVFELMKNVVAPLLPTPQQVVLKKRKRDTE